MKILNTSSTQEDFEPSYPYELAENSDGILPSGCPCMSTIFVVDKVDVVFCDGKDHWYREKDKPVDAGQPISALFT